MDFKTTITDTDNWRFRSSAYFNKIWVNGLSGTDGEIWINDQNLFGIVSGNTSLISSLQSLTGNWESAFTTVQLNSALWEESTDISYLSSVIDNNTLDITEMSLASGYWDSAYTNLVSNSAAYLSGVDLTAIASASGNWNSAYTTVQSNSSTTWLGDSAVDSLVHLNSSNWDSAYTNIMANSAAYLSGVDLTAIVSASANWNSVYTTTNANSASWDYQGTDKVNLDQTSPQTMVGAFNFPIVRANTVTDDGCETPLQVYGTKITVSDPTGLASTPTYSILYDLYGVSDNGSYADTSAGSFIDNYFGVKIWSITTASDMTQLWTPNYMNANIGDSSSTLFQLKLVWSDLGGTQSTEQYYIEIYDSNSGLFYYLNVIAGTTNLTVPNFTGWTAGNAPVGIPTPYYITEGTLPGYSEWYLYSYKIDCGVKVFCATPISITDSDPNGQGFKTTLSWSDVSVDGYILYNSYMGYYIDVGNTFSQEDDGLFNGMWVNAAPTVTPVSPYNQDIAHFYNTDYSSVIKGTGQFSISCDPTLSPFILNSNIVNTNLNADLLDGQHASEFELAGAVRSVGATLPIVSSGGTTPIISHSTASGYQHIPSGGASNQLLKNGNTWTTVTESSGALAEVTSITQKATDNLTSVINKVATNNEFSITNQINYKTAGSPYYATKQTSSAAGATLTSDINLGTTFSIGIWLLDPTGISSTSLIRSLNSSHQIIVQPALSKLLFNMSGRNLAFTTITFTPYNRFVIIRNGSTINCYQNGTQLTILSDNAPTANPAFDVHSIAQGSNGVYSIDEVVFWNKVLSIGEIASDYNSGSGKYYSSADSGVINCWHIDEGSGTTAIDSVGGINASWAATPTYTTSLVALPTLTETVKVISSKNPNIAVVNDKGTLTIGDSAVPMILNGPAIYTDTHKGYTHANTVLVTDSQTGQSISLYLRNGLLTID